MYEMAEIDDESQKAYEVFKNKYSQLYFPCHMEDAGFYIAMSNLDAAFLVNRNYEVSISGKVENLRDINSYQELMNLNRAFYSDNTSMTRAGFVEFTLSSTSMNSVGPEYDSGWTEYGKRKVKLKARRRFEAFTPAPGFSGSISLMHLEFCFRKKTFLGWVNYSCKSTVNFTANIPGVSRPVTNTSSNSGSSSHDTEFEYPISITQDATYWYYTFVETPCRANIDFQDIDQTLNYSWNMTGIQCKTPVSANHATIIPTL